MKFETKYKTLHQEKMCLQMSSDKWPFCLDLNVSIESLLLLKFHCFYDKSLITIYIDILFMH